MSLLKYKTLINAKECLQKWIRKVIITALGKVSAIYETLLIQRRAQLFISACSSAKELQIISAPPIGYSLAKGLCLGKETCMTPREYYFRCINGANMSYSLCQGNNISSYTSNLLCDLLGQLNTSFMQILTTM